MLISGHEHSIGFISGFDEMFIFHDLNFHIGNLVFAALEGFWASTVGRGGLAWTKQWNGEWRGRDMLKQAVKEKEVPGAK